MRLESLDVPGYDLARVRGWFPALERSVARFDGPGGSLVPRQVATMVAEAMTSGMCQRGQSTPQGRLAESTVAGARAAVGDLLGSDPGGVVFGRSATALTFDLARTLAAGWGPGDEVVVTRLDHDANIRPWVVAAQRAGAVVRWLDFDPESGMLDDLEPLLSERTRLVALTGASNLIGTAPDVAAYAASAHAAGALVHVDGVHLAAHRLLDRQALGADTLVCSPYKFFGPHLGALAADPDLLETLHPDKLLPSTEQVPERFELGTLPYEMLAGVSAAVEVLADLSPTAGRRRDRLVISMSVLRRHEERLLDRLLSGLAELSRVRVHGDPRDRTPTLLLQVTGRPAQQVSEELVEHGVVAPAGSFYALEASRHLGLGDDGGLRVGLSPYTSAADVDRLLDGLASVGG